MRNLINFFKSLFEVTTPITPVTVSELNKITLVSQEPQKTKVVRKPNQPKKKTTTAPKKTNTKTIAPPKTTKRGNTTKKG